VGRDPRGVFRCAKAVADEGVLTLSEGLGDTRLPCGRDILSELHLRTLDRELADSGPSPYGPVAALAAASAPPPPALAAAVSRLLPPMWGGLARPPYTARGGARNTRSRRTYPLVGSSSVPRIGGHSGPPVRPMPLSIGRGLPNWGPLDSWVRSYGRCWGVA